MREVRQSRTCEKVRLNKLSYSTPTAHHRLLVAGDRRFTRALDEGIKSKPDMLRDACGIVVRLVGMERDGELGDLTKAQVERLEDAAESAMSCLDRHIDPHHVGAFYMQVLTPALSAMRNELSQKSLMNMVRGAGRKIVKWMSRNPGGIGTA